MPDFGARPRVVVADMELTADMAALIRSVVIELDTSAPDSCRIVFSDPRRETLQLTGLDFLAPLRVEAARAGSEDTEVLFEGTIFSLAFGTDERGALVSAVAYD